MDSSEQENYKVSTPLINLVQPYFCACSRVGLKVSPLFVVAFWGFCFVFYLSCVYRIPDIVRTVIVSLNSQADFFFQDKKNNYFNWDRKVISCLSSSLNMACKHTYIIIIYSKHLISISFYHKCKKTKHGGCQLYMYVRSCIAHLILNKEILI